jgi:hypothetical protein
MQQFEIEPLIAVQSERNATVGILRRSGAAEGAF